MKARARPGAGGMSGCFSCWCPSRACDSTPQSVSESAGATTVKTGSRRVRSASQADLAASTSNLTVAALRPRSSPQRSALDCLDSIPFDDCSMHHCAVCASWEILTVRTVPAIYAGHGGCASSAAHRPRKRLHDYGAALAAVLSETVSGWIATPLPIATTNLGSLAITVRPTAPLPSAACYRLALPAPAVA